VDTITRNHDVDLLLPGQKPCAYFVIISAQDSAYRFLSSLFFSLALPRLSDYARLEGKGGRLPVLVNFCLDEYCNIGYMDGIADALNSIRGFNMSCQVVVQSLSQWQEKYPGKEWENQLATFDQTLYMGCNDLTSAEYISKKCGKVTISVTNNQMPLMPLFSPVYTSTRPYSQTRSNTQRDLMLPDEIPRLDRRQCIALFQGHKPALLYKLAPEELPGYNDLKPCRVVEYVPEWKRREDEKKTDADKTPPPQQPEPTQEEQPPAQETVNPAQDLEYTVEDTPKPGGSLGMIDMSGVRGDDDTDEDETAPPRQ
jgi:type IV secretion system protein VirD4